MDFIEPCFGIGHNLSLICQMTSEDIKHQLIIINIGYNLSLISHTVSVDVKHHERRIGYNGAQELCDVTVEVAFMGSPSLIIRTVSVDVKQQLKKKKKKMLQYNYNIAQRVTKLLWGEGSRHGVLLLLFLFVCLFVVVFGH